MFCLSELKQTRFYQEIEEEVGPRKWWEGARSVVLRQLNYKLGLIPDKTLERINELSPDQFESFSKALLDFQTANDLKAWLADL